MILLWGLLVYREYLLAPYQDHIMLKRMYQDLGTATAITMAFLAYDGFKHFSIWLLNRDSIKKGVRLSPLRFELLWFGFIWGLAMAFVIFVHPYWGVGLFLSLMVPCIFINYLVCLYWLIPKYYQKVNNNQFWLITGAVTLGVNLPLNGTFTAIATYHPFVFIVFFLIFWVMQVVVIFPVSLYIHKTRKERVAELKGLQTELGTSNANLQFLRSQINPHFLFNALNTLYTAPH
jgi:two-component system LytT family sensor kinase